MRVANLLSRCEAVAIHFMLWRAAFVAVVAVLAYHHYMPGRLRLEDISDVVTTAQPFDVAGFGTVCIVRTDH